MKHKSGILAFCAAICLAAPAADADAGFLCKTEQVTGFAYNPRSGTWSPAEFNAGRQYVVSRSDLKGVAWEVAQVGERHPTALCRRDFSPGGTLSCEGIGVHQFKLNKANRRFMHAYLMGYWTDRNGDVPGPPHPSLFKQGENAPYVEIGTCKAL